MSSTAVEVMKEAAFGTLFGLGAGYAAKKAGSHLVAGAAVATFLLLRGAIFDGRHLATWSPLAADDASFGAHLRRKARREAVSAGRRCRIFVEENLIVIGGFAGGMLVVNGATA